MRTLKHLLALAICISGSLSGFATSDKAQIRIVSLSVNAVMPANVMAWGSLPNGFLMTAQSAGLEGISSRLVIQVKQGGQIICGNAATGLAQTAFTTRSFSASDISSALAGCPQLPQGAYTICAQFMGESNEALSAEVCTEFTVESTHSNAAQPISPPVNTAPVDNKFYIAEETKKPIVFQWRPVSPVPEEKITYRFRLWQLSEWQSAAAAIESSQPIITKDVIDATQVVLTNEISIPCKAPYQCKFVWNVQALNGEGQAIGSSGGYSIATAIVITNYIIQLNDIKVACTSTPGIYTFSYAVTNLNVGTAKLSNFVVTSSAPAGAIITSFSPPLNTTIPSGAQITITGTLSAAPTLTNICIGAEITDVTNTFWKASRDTCTAVLPCKCDACDIDKVNIIIPPTTNIVVNGNNSITLNQPITIATAPLKLVQAVKAELEYFEFVPESEDCLPCNRDSKTFGNMDNGTLPPAVTTGNGTHGLVWSFMPPKNFTTASTAAITITLPPTVKCCSATIRWCVRYVVTFTDCTVCYKLVCYEKKKEGCGSGNGNGNGIPNN